MEGARRRMRVLHVIPSVAVAHGGPSTAMRLFEKALQQAGVAVETATTDDDGPGRRIATPLRLPVLQDGTTRLYFGKWTEFYKVAPGLAWWIWRHAKDYALVHIHAQFSFTSIAAGFAARWHGVPYVVRPLGTLKLYGLSRRRPLLKRLSLALFESRVLQHAAAVHFTSQAEWDDAKELGIPMRGVVIPLGIEPTPVGDVGTLNRSNPELNGKRVILFLSRLDQIKNLEGLLQAFAQIAGRHPDVRLLIAGSGQPQYVSRLKALADELNLSGRVTWLGHVEGETKAAALAVAEVFVLPSFSENFGIAAAEALMAGLPCVLGQGVALADEVAAAGAGVSVQPDAQSIATGLEHILGDSGLRDQMGLRARELALARYSLNVMGERLLTLYQSILSESTMRGTKLGRVD